MNRSRCSWLRSVPVLLAVLWGGCDKPVVSDADIPDKPMPHLSQGAEPAVAAAPAPAKLESVKGSEGEGKAEEKPMAKVETETKPKPAPEASPAPDAAAAAAEAALKAEKKAFDDAVSSSKKKAVEQFPDIGKAGSPLNSEFVTLAKGAQSAADEILKKADWPLILAAKASENVERKEKEAKAAEEAAMKAKAKAEGLVTVAELTGNLGEYQGKQVTISGKVTKASIFPPSFVFVEIDERVNFNLPVKELLPDLKDVPRLQMKDGKVVVLTYRGSMEPPKSPSAKPDGFKPLAEAGMTVKVRGEVEVKGQNTAGLIGPKIVR